MFLAPRQRKTTVFTRFWASASKNHSIYSVLWPGPSKNTGICAVSCMLSEAFFGCQRHKNIVNYTIFTRGQYQQIIKNWPKIDQKTPNKDLQNASANFTLFSPTPNPQKRENPSRLRDFRGGSAAPARPRVAKAMLSNHHRTASPDIRLPPLPPTPPDSAPPPVHPVFTIIDVIYSVFCVWCSKNIVCYRVLWPSPSPGFISATLKNHRFFRVLGLRKGSGTENWTSWRPWCQHRANIGLDVGYMGQHKAKIGASLRQHRANIGKDVGYMGRQKG